MLITGLWIKPVNSDMVVDFQLLPTEVEVCQKQMFSEPEMSKVTQKTATCVFLKQAFRYFLLALHQYQVTDH